MFIWEFIEQPHMSCDVMKSRASCKLMASQIMDMNWASSGAGDGREAWSLLQTTRGRRGQMWLNWSELNWVATCTKSFGRRNRERPRGERRKMSTHISDKGWSLYTHLWAERAIETAYTSQRRRIRNILTEKCLMASHQRDVQSP